MAEDGIVGPYNGSQAREVMMNLAQWQQLTAGEAASPPEPPTPTPQSSGESCHSDRNETTRPHSPQTKGTGPSAEEIDDEDDLEDEFEEEYEDEEEEEEDPNRTIQRTTTR